MAKEFRERHRVEDPVGGNTALARHLDTPMHVIELADGVGVRIDAQNASITECCLMPAPVKIEPPGMGIDLDDNVVLSADSKIASMSMS